MHMCTSPSSINLKPVIPLYILEALHWDDVVLTYCTRVALGQTESVRVRVYLSFCIQMKLFFLTNVRRRFFVLLPICVNRQFINVL